MMAAISLAASETGTVARRHREGRDMPPPRQWRPPTPAASHGAPARRKADPRLGVVTPLGNESRCINLFLDEVTAHLDEEDRIYCVLDGVSKDGTRDIVAARAAADARIVCLWAPQNRCVVDAYFAGYRAAYAAGCRWILEMDAGFSHPPAMMPEFMAAMEDGYDYAGGSRFAPGGAHQGPWRRRVLSYGGTWLARWLLGSRMTDMTSGYECFNRRAMAHVLSRGVRSRANFFQTEIRHMMHRFRWREIPFTYTNDQASVGRRAVGESFRILWQLARHDEQ